MAVLAFPDMIELLLIGGNSSEELELQTLLFIMLLSFDVSVFLVAWKSVISTSFSPSGSNLFVIVFSTNLSLLMLVFDVLADSFWLFDYWAVICNFCSSLLSVVFLLLSSDYYYNCCFLSF